LHKQRQAVISDLLKKDFSARPRGVANQRQFVRRIRSEAGSTKAAAPPGDYGIADGKLCAFVFCFGGVDFPI
jgi:hypothetical protein